jgi:hypothetical protein
VALTCGAPVEILKVFQLFAKMVTRGLTSRHIARSAHISGEKGEGLRSQWFIVSSWVRSSLPWLFSQVECRRFIGTLFARIKDALGALRMGRNETMGRRDEERTSCRWSSGRENDLAEDNSDVDLAENKFNLEFLLFSIAQLFEI